MHLQPISPTDIEYAAALDPEHEYERLGRLRWLLRTPYARTVCLQNTARFHGWAASLHFGGSAWITDLVLSRAARTDGSGRMLVEALIEQADQAGCTTQVVQVHTAHVTVWHALGFNEAGAYQRFEGGHFLQATREEVVHWEPRHAMGVLRLDERATGLDRSKWLLEHAYLGRVYEHNGHVHGFSLALPREGIIVADDPAIGLELQRWHFPVQDHIIVPDGNIDAHAHLIERQYAAEPAGIRMVRGTLPAYRPELIFAHPFEAMFYSV